MRKLEAVIVLLFSVFTVTAEQTREAPHTICSDWLRLEPDAWPTIVEPYGNPCRNYTANDVERFEFVVNDVATQIHSSFAEPPNVFPGPPISSKRMIESLRITDVTNGHLAGQIALYPFVGDDMHRRRWSTPLQLPSGWVYHYTLHRVPKSERTLVLEKLARFERTPLYGRFGSTTYADVPYLVVSDSFAHYSRVYDLASPEARESLNFRGEWEPYVTEKNVRRLWGECTIPIDEEWFPTGQPVRCVRPIAVETAESLYLVGEEVWRQTEHAMMIDVFEGRVFDLSGCSAGKACVDSVLAALGQELAQEFAATPLEAGRSKKVLPPHQFRFERRFEISRPLAGVTGPYFELSTYTLVLWEGARSPFPGSGESYNSRRDQLYLQASHALQIAVGRQGSYEEPTAQQYAAYQKAVEAAIGRAVAATATKLGGSVDDGVGTINSATKTSGGR